MVMLATPRRRRRPERFEQRTGPWRDVRTTQKDPFDEPENLLVDAYNGYIPDPEGLSGFYARPGFRLLNNGNAFTTSATTFRGQGAFSHIALDGTTYNFVVFNGKLFRLDSIANTGTDVTPVGITIDPGVTVRVYATSFGNQLIITDGVNKPWLATNLSSTPITGTYIQFNAANDPWTVFGRFEVYGGAVFCILNTVNSVSARTDIAWSKVGDASLGFQQTGYDYRWTLEQSSTAALYGLAGTNTQLYYFRANAIGSISGEVGPNLSSTPTHDAITQNVGTLAPQSIVQFGDFIYFTDGQGRPYSLRGRTLTPIWLQMRGIIESSPVGYPGLNKITTTASFEPFFNLYLVAIFTSNAAQSGPAVEAYAFDAKTGTYMGRWQVGGTTIGAGDGFQIETLATLTDSNGRSSLCVLGSIAAPTTGPATSGYVWLLNPNEAQGVELTTEAGVLLTTEAGVTLTTEGTAANWLDNASVPVIGVITARLGYDPETVINADQVDVLVGTTAPCKVSIETAAVTTTLEGTPTPSTTQDSVSRLTCGVDGMQGRGVTITVQPTTATSQWSCQSVTLKATRSNSPPDET